MTSTVNKLAKAISTHKSYFNPKKLFRRTASASAEAPARPEVEYEAKPAWKLLGARKLAREAMSNAHEEADMYETQAAVLSNRAAWSVLGMRHQQRLTLAKSSNEDRIADRYNMKKRLSIKDSLEPYLDEVRDREDVNVHLEEGSLNAVVCA